jgi:hypothetical protein
VSDSGPPRGDTFGTELAEAFLRHRPQGSVTWNYDVAFAFLHEEFGADDPDGSLHSHPDVRRLSAVAEAAGPEAAVPEAAVPEAAEGRQAAEGQSGGNGVRSAAQRVVLGRLRQWVDRRAATVATEVTERALRAGLGRTGVSHSVEALRFLALRVQALEESAARRRAPLASPESLVPPPSLQEWLEPVTELVRSAPGPVLHAECGDGRLVERLRSAGLGALGVEPRGALAFEASRRQVPVEITGARAYLASADRGSLGAIVLSGIVDRAPVEDLVELVGMAVERLAPGGVLVVIGSDPQAPLAGWPAVARDLLAGRPLHPDTWRLLMVRAGLVGVGPVASAGDAEGYAVAGRSER